MVDGGKKRKGPRGLLVRIPAIGNAMGVVNTARYCDGFRFVRRFKPDIAGVLSLGKATVGRTPSNSQNRAVVSRWGFT